MKSKSNGGRETGREISESLQCLFYQLLQTEEGGVQVYETALKCVLNQELRSEWEKYLGETKRHVEIARELLQEVGLDPAADGPGRKTVRMMGESLVKMMEAALADGDPEAAELTACDAVVSAETKDHMNWELLGKVAGRVKGETGKKVREACEEVEEQEDRHLYHSKGWARELWFQSLGMMPVLPPPEERKDVRSATAAERAKKSRRRFSKAPHRRS